MKQTVIGIYDEVNKARQAEQELIRNGFDKDTVDLADNTGRSDARERNKGFFSSLFGSDDDDARRHAEVAERGTVVTVHTQSMQEAERAAAILDKFGTLDVSDYDRNTSSNRSSTATDMRTDATVDQDRSVDMDRRTDATLDSGDTSIPIIEERMNIGKREVETGGARVRSRIVERPVEEHLRLREEHISIDRQPVNRRATDADLDTFKEGTIDATAHAEVPVVDKEARVVEEISIHKEVSDRDEVVRDSVRKTEVDVDKVKNKERDSKY